LAAHVALSAMHAGSELAVHAVLFPGVLLLLFPARASAYFRRR
jgi:hypothetical protein